MLQPFHLGFFPVRTTEGNAVGVWKASCLYTLEILHCHPITEFPEEAANNNNKLLSFWGKIYDILYFFFFFSCQKSHSLIRKFLLYFYTTREEQLHFIIPNFNIFVIHGSNCASVTTDRDLPRSHEKHLSPQSFSGYWNVHIAFACKLPHLTDKSNTIFLIWQGSQNPLLVTPCQKKNNVELNVAAEPTSTVRGKTLSL